MSATTSSYSPATIASMSLAMSVVLLGIYIYYSCYPLFDSYRWTSQLTDKVLSRIVSTHLFNNLVRCKLFILLFQIFSIGADRGRQATKGSIKVMVSCLLGGLVLFFCHSIILTVIGWVMILAAGTRVARMIGAPMSIKDPFGRQKAGFPQEQRRVISPYSLHLRGKYRYQGSAKNSWINLVNPRRGILIMGSPGSGKSWFIIEPLIRQWMEKGHVLFIYDFKFDTLSRLAWKLFQQFHGRFPAGAAFYCINFSDLSRSHRCNVLQPKTLTWLSDALGASKSILLSMNKTWVHRQGEFFVESPINFLAAVIWFLKKHRGGLYCTLPHAIELAQTPYPQLLTILRTEPDIQTLVQPFFDAFKNKTMEMLDGQIASARVPLGRLASPDLYYILTGSDLQLDINDPGAPKILCLGGRPDRQEALGPVLSLYIDRVCELSNVVGRRPCALVCDEFGTVRAKNMLNAYATARSNDIVPILAVQDLNQLRTQYTRDEANTILNISGNLFCGQTGGDTAKWVSERFPMVLKDQQSVSKNSWDTTVSTSQRWEEVVTPATLAMLSSGEFAGVVADDPDGVMELKGFHAKIVRDEKALEDGGLPIVRVVDEAAVQEQFERIRREVADLVSSEIERMTLDSAWKGMILK